jgi:hypothetical protein
MAGTGEVSGQSLVERHLWPIVVNARAQTDLLPPP